MSFGWARPRTRNKSEQFSRSFALQAPEYISPSTVLRKRSEQSSRKSSAGTFSLNHKGYTMPGTVCPSPPIRPQLVQGDRGWFAEDTLLGPRNKGSNLTHSSSYGGDPGEWCLRTRDCPTARRESCTAQKPDPVTLPFAFLRVESRVAIWFIPGCCELD